MTVAKKPDPSGMLLPLEAKAGIVVASGADQLLERVRPEWQAKGLIKRTNRLLAVDPSSACQRLLNAAIYDLRNKILIAGLDIAKEAASRFRLPSVTKDEDISENYSSARVIELSYRMGILTRTEWKKIRRCYEIRGDLEHEDEEYEADIDDILYIFKNCVEIVLERDPIEIIRVDDVIEFIDAPTAAIVTGEILEEYDLAPDVRQKEIVEHLVNSAMDSKNPDIVRQNSMELLRQFHSITKNKVLVEVGTYLQERYRRKPLDLVVMKVGQAAGVLPYLKQRKKKDFFEAVYTEFTQVGYQWRRVNSHRKLFDEFEDIGGVTFCPEVPRRNFVLWMVLCYLGEPGGYGDWGRNRKVFYSNVTAPRIYQLFDEANELLAADLKEAKKDKRVKAAIRYAPIARRLETLEDLVASDK